MKTMEIGTKRPRILIIDDEQVVLESCTEILADHPYEVATADNGAWGLELVEDFLPDLVFVDLKMPGISGMHVLDSITREHPTVVTVVITGYATVDSAIEAMKKGAYDFLPKPFTPDQFRVIASRSLEKRKLVLVVRETPLHPGHLRLMSMAADMGAHILPPMPSFYHHPKTIDDIIDQTIGKVFDYLGIEHDLFRRWGGGNSRKMKSGK